MCQLKQTKISWALVALLAVSLSVQLSWARGGDITEQMKVINQKVSVVQSDLKRSIKQLTQLTQNGGGGISGEQMIDQTIAKVRALEQQIGDKSQLNKAIDDAVAALDAQDKKYK